MSDNVPDNVPDNIPRNIWDNIVDILIIEEQLDDNAVEIFFSICSNRSEKLIDFESLRSMDKKTRYICFFAACMCNHDLKIIIRMINDFEIDINQIHRMGNNCLIYGCEYNTNLNIIKYLIKGLKMDINHTNNDGDNCLIAACRNNTNLEVIKYLTQDLKMDINHTNNDQFNCLMSGCWDNTNLEIIRYLIEDLKMDINYKPHGDNCLTCAFIGNTNLEIIKYLIESTNAEILFSIHPHSVQDRCEKWKKIIKLLSKNSERFIDALINGLNIFPHDDEMVRFLQTINPLLLSCVPQYLRLCTLNLNTVDPMEVDPMDKIFKFNDFVKHVEELYSFDVPIHMLYHIKSHDNESIPPIDYTEDSTLLFIYNGSEYYGHRNIVYESILCLKEIKDVADFDQPLTLSGRLPKYAINLWIWSMHSKRFNLMNIRPCDIVQFLNHIDQYPTDFLTISSIECDLIKYLDTESHEIVFEELIPRLKEISMRCRLKRLYLWIHNKMVNTSS